MKKVNTKKLKKERGITLVALVVTIVVLLILAGVSINMVLGNNGLITKAKDAKTKTEQDQVNMETGMNNLYDEMMGILGENGGTGDSDGDGNEGGSGGSGNEGDGSGDSVDLSALAIGDLVNYTYDTVAEGYSLLSTQSGYDDDQTVPQSTTTLQWKVLNIDEENGTIDLVSSEPSDNTVYFKGALGYNNGVYLLDDMCAALYSNTSLGITARSIDLVDMERHLTTGENGGIAARNAYKASSTNTVYGSTYKYETKRQYPKLYAHEIGQGIGVTDGTTITQPNLNGVDPYNESSKYYTAPTTDTSDTADTALTVTQTYYYIPINEANYGPAATVLSNSSSYWVASRFVNTGSSSRAYFGLRYADTDMRGYLFYSNGYPLSINHRLRPVVSLSSDLLDGTKDASGAWNLVSE